MNIELNGNKVTLEPMTLAEFLNARRITPETRGVAVACNGRIAPRTAWENHLIQEGDAIEVIHAVQGG